MIWRTLVLIFLASAALGTILFLGFLFFLYLVEHYA